MSHLHVLHAPLSASFSLAASLALGGSLLSCAGGQASGGGTAGSLRNGPGTDCSTGPALPPLGSTVGESTDVAETVAFVPHDILRYPCDSTILDESLRFVPGTAMLREGEIERVEHFAASLAARPGFELVEVQGYADEPESDSAQVALSLARARVVLEELVRLGVPTDRLLLAGYGNRCAGWDDAPRTCLPDPNNLVYLRPIWIDGRPSRMARTCPAAEELSPPIPERFLHPDAGP